MKALGPVEAQLQANKDERDFIRRYITAHPVHAFFKACDPLFEATSKPESCIPGGYERSKAVVRLSVFFQKLPRYSGL